MHNTYTAPTDFRAARLGRNYSLSANGYVFADLIKVSMADGTEFFELHAPMSTFADEMDLHRHGRPVVCGTDRRSFRRLLLECKLAFLKADRYDWEGAMEAAADRETELAGERALERNDEHAYWTDWEDRMGMS